MTHTEFQQFIARNTWIFAKTYAAFCPHEYVVKDRLSEEEKAVFEQIVSFIRENGFVAQYGKLRPNRYYSVEDHYYWTMGAPIEETTILNRAKLSDYEFFQTDSGLRVQYRGAARNRPLSRPEENNNKNTC